jgi:hypothetical protein
MAMVNHQTKTLAISTPHEYVVRNRSFHHPSTVSGHFYNLPTHDAHPHHALHSHLNSPSTVLHRRPANSGSLRHALLHQCYSHDVERAQQHHLQRHMPNYVLGCWGLACGFERCLSLSFPPFAAHPLIPNSFFLATSSVLKDVYMAC